MTAVAAALLLEASGEIPASSLAGWSSTGVSVAVVDVTSGEHIERCRAKVLSRHAFEVEVGGQSFNVVLDALGALKRTIAVDGRAQTIAAVVAGDTLHVDMAGIIANFRDTSRQAKAAASAEAASRLLAPMNGKVVRVLAQAGDAVAAGQCIVVLEAMKMQHEITAPRDGALAAVHVSDGQQVATRFVLAEMASCWLTGGGRLRICQHRSGPEPSCTTFTTNRGTLHAEDVDLSRIAAEVGTPFYCLFDGDARAALQAVRQGASARMARSAKHHVFFAMKANSNLAVLKTLAKLGAGADTVSEGEVRRALAAGIPADKIVFSGVGKSAEELAFAVDAGIYQINVETESELDLLSKVASARGKRQSAVIRVNPDVGAGGHAKITTGSDANKFGVSIAEAERMLRQGRQSARRRHEGARRAHRQPDPGSRRPRSRVQTAARHDRKTAPRRPRGRAARSRRRSRHCLRAEPRTRIEGPGLIEAYAAMVDKTLAGLDVERGFEPGRHYRRQCRRSRHQGAASQSAAAHDVSGRRRGDERSRAARDVRGLSRDLAGRSAAARRRPARSTTWSGRSAKAATHSARRARCPKPSPGDLIAFMTAGAYGAVMSSTYNSRLLVPEVLVSGDQWAVVRPRLSFEDLLGLDRMAPWL